MKARINIGAAIQALQKNLDDHIIEYNDAIEVWLKDAGEALIKMGRALDRDGLKASGDEMFRLWHAKPVDSRALYSRHLGMLKRAQESGETTIECDEDDYDRIFQDNWDWRASSKARNTFYSARNDRNVEAGLPGGGR